MQRTNVEKSTFRTFQNSVSPPITVRLFTRPAREASAGNGPHRSTPESFNWCPSSVTGLPILMGQAEQLNEHDFPHMLTAIDPALKTGTATC